MKPMCLRRLHVHPAPPRVSAPAACPKNSPTLETAPVGGATRTSVIFVFVGDWCYIRIWDSISRVFLEWSQSAPSKVGDGGRGGLLS